MNATTTDIHDAFELLRNGLRVLGFNRADGLTSNSIHQSGPFLNRVFDNVRYSVRLPRGAAGLGKLIFEVEASHVGRRLTAWARLDVTTADPMWVETVAQWMRKQQPLALERRRQDDERRQKQHQLSRMIFAAQTELRNRMMETGHSTKFPTVMNDGEKIVGARVEVFITGSTVDEIAEKMLAIFSQNPGN